MKETSNHFVHEDFVYNTKAAEAFMPFLFEIIKPDSVLDVGCGIGTWLSVFQKYGASRILGVDGDYVDRQKLYIDSKNFLAKDLEKEINLKEKFDLVVCLEVAEHLPLSKAEEIVKTLTNHSDIILFSAALPKQGGQNHVNEQSFSYWVDKFKKVDYRFIDAFRYKIWNIDEIDAWYRQNMFLVVKDDHNLLEVYQQPDILDYYHPSIYIDVVNDRDRWKNEGEYWKMQYESIVNGKSGVKISLNAFSKSVLTYLGVK